MDERKRPKRASSACHFAGHSREGQPARILQYPMWVQHQHGCLSCDEAAADNNPGPSRPSFFPSARDPSQVRTSSPSQLHLSHSTEPLPYPQKSRSHQRWGWSWSRSLTNATFMMVRVQYSIKNLPQTFPLLHTVVFSSLCLPLSLSPFPPPTVTVSSRTYDHGNG